MPISMPLPAPPGEDILVEMYGFGMTQFRLVHSITGPEYENLSVPIFSPEDPAAPVVYDDAAIEADPGRVP